MSDDAKAKLLYVAIGSALDIGMTQQQIIKLFSKKNIDYIVMLLMKKAQGSGDG